MITNPISGQKPNLRVFNPTSTPPLVAVVRTGTQMPAFFVNPCERNRKTLMLSFTALSVAGSATPQSRKPLVCAQASTPAPTPKPSSSKNRSSIPPPHSALRNQQCGLNDELRALLRKNHVREAVALVEQQLETNPSNPIPLVDYRCLHEIILICNESRRWELALRAFRLLESLGYSVSRSTSCILFKVLQRASRITEAERVLSSLWDSSLTLADGTVYTLDEREMNRRIPDEKMVTQVANAAVDAGKPEAAERMLLVMEKNGVPLTLFSTSVLIKAYGRQGRPDMVRYVLENLTLVPDVIIFNSAIDAYVRCHDLSSAMKALRDMPQNGLMPNARSYNPILRHLAKAGKMDATFSLHDQMLKRHIPPSARTMNALIQACVCAKDFQRARGLLEEAVEAESDSRVRVTKDLLVGYTTLISGLAAEGDMKGAEDLLTEMTESVERSGKGAMFELDVGIALTAILSALLAQDEFVRAWTLFRSVRRRFKIRLPPDMYNAVIRGLVKRGDAISMEAAGIVFDEMMQVFRKRQNARRRRDVETRHGDPSIAATDAGPRDIERAYNSIIDGFVRLGDTTSGERYLDDMEDNGHEPTVVTYTTLINGYGKEHDIISARRVFKRMQRAGISPDRVTMNAFLGACVRCDDMDLAIRVFEDMQRLGGRISPNLVSFSALIAGYVRAGQREEAWDAYEEMKGIGLVPNERLLDRMMVAFVSPGLRPTRGEAWSENDYNLEEIEIVEEDEDGTRIEVLDDGEDISELSDEIDEDEVQLEELRRRIGDGHGWASRRALILLDDMEKCKCSEISRQRWRMALKKVWM